MDWEPASSAIRLIVGGQGHIVCTLRVEPGYPESGAVKLEGITGATEDMDMANIKVIFGASCFSRKSKIYLYYNNQHVFTHQFLFRDVFYAH